MWKPITETPASYTPILIKGPVSVPNVVHGVSYSSGYYDPHLTAWRNWDGARLGFEPSHWIYIHDLEYQIPFSSLTRGIATFQILEHMLTGRPREAPNAIIQMQANDEAVIDQYRDYPPAHEVIEALAEPPQCSDNDPERDCRCGGQRGTPSCMFPTMVPCDYDGIHSGDCPGCHGTRRMKKTKGAGC